jgi:predicted PurR-regulated permease PerM
MLGLSYAPKLSTLIFSDATVRFVQPALTVARGMASDLVLVLIYVAFLYVSSARYPRKIVQIFPKHDTRTHAMAVMNEIRRAMEQYLWVQTALSIITTVLTYVTLLAVGLDNALFWAFVIFVLNYIPTIGSIVAAILPALFAIAQPTWPGWMPTDPMWCALIVFLAVSVWQFAIGNFVGPRMTGSSLNISALVVLLSLAVWGALWGLTGMFLSAPLTVLIMIVLAQIPGARWIAILLSEDGRPDYLAPPERDENIVNN